YVGGRQVDKDLTGCEVDPFLAEEESGPFRISNDAWAELRCRRRAYNDLARVGSGLHDHCLACRRSGHDEFSVRVSDQEEVEHSAMYADRHAKRYSLARPIDRIDFLQCAAHAS